MLALIVGIGPNNVIGKGNELPWNIPEDLKNFKEITSGNSVIMGLKTYESIGRPLPNRNNIVLHFEKLDIPGTTVCTSIPEAIEKGNNKICEIILMLLVDLHRSELLDKKRSLNIAGYSIILVASFYQALIDL